MSNAENNEQLANSVIEPYLTEQRHSRDAITLQRSRHAKLFFGCSVALLSGYFTVQLQRYIGGKEIDPFAIIVLLVLALSVRNTWRAT